MSNVLPSEALRTQAEAAMQEAQKLSTDLTLDSELHAIFAGLDGSDLDADAQRLLSHVLRDFQRAGVDRSEEDRQRLRELAEREIVVGQEFAKNIRDDVRTVDLDPSSSTAYRTTTSRSTRSAMTDGSRSPRTTPTSTRC